MILLFIITSILYLIMMFFVITLYCTYRNDIEELEKRLLQLEKLINSKLSKEYIDKIYNNLYDNLNEKICCMAIEVQRLKNKKCKCRKEVK